MSASDNLSQGQFETYYHRTDSDSAGSIIKSGKLKPHPAEDNVFVSNILNGKARHFGSSVVEVQVPKKARRTDYSDNAGVGEKWLAFSPRDVKVVRAWSELKKK